MNWPVDETTTINGQRIEDRPELAQKSDAGGSGQVPAQRFLLPDDHDEDR